MLQLYILDFYLALVCCSVVSALFLFLCVFVILLFCIKHFYQWFQCLFVFCQGPCTRVVSKINNMGCQLCGAHPQRCWSRDGERAGARAGFFPHFCKQHGDSRSGHASRLINTMLSNLELLLTCKRHTLDQVEVRHRVNC